MSTIEQQSKKGDLRVWHIPQVPMKAFHVSVASVDEARKILKVLADYDAFQYENNIKPDYANVNGLAIFDGEDWIDWYDEDGNNIDGNP